MKADPQSSDYRLELQLLPPETPQKATGSNNTSVSLKVYDKNKI